MTTVATILQIVADHYEMTPLAAMRGYSDKRAVSVRGLTYHFSTVFLGLGAPAVARALGRGDHKNTSNLAARTRARLADDAGFRAVASEIEAKIAATLDAQVEEMVSDLPGIIQQNESGATVEAVAEWFGITPDAAANLMQIAVYKGKVAPVTHRDKKNICKILPLSL